MIQIKRKNSCRALQGQRGATMIEIMIAILVFSVGLLGVASTQTRGLSNTQSALHRSYAAQLSYELIDVMRSNMAVVSLQTTALGNVFNSFNTATTDFTHNDDCFDSTKSCDSATLAESTLADWTVRVESILPNGRGLISQIDAATNTYEVGLSWSDLRSDQWRVDDANVDADATAELDKYMITITTRFRL